MSELCFTVPGPPAPAVRMTRRGKYVKDHKKRVQMDRYLAFKDAIGYQANLAGAEPRAGDVRVSVTVLLSEPNKRRWDVSNVLKACEDGLNGIAYRDDKQVVDARIRVMTPPVSEMDEATIIKVVYQDGAP